MISDNFRFVKLRDMNYENYYNHLFNENVLITRNALGII